MMKNFKKLICLMLVAVIALGSTAVIASAASYRRGDADGNGDVEIIDVTMIMRLLAGLVNDPDGMIAKRGDVEGDGLAITSATWIQRWLADMQIPYPVGEQVSEAPTQAPTARSTDYELPIV